MYCHCVNITNHYKRTLYSDIRHFSGKHCRWTFYLSVQDQNVLDSTHFVNTKSELCLLQNMFAVVNLFYININIFVCTEWLSTGGFYSSNWTTHKHRINIKISTSHHTWTRMWSDRVSCFLKTINVVRNLAFISLIKYKNKIISMPLYPTVTFEI